MALKCVLPEQFVALNYHKKKLPLRVSFAVLLDCGFYFSSGVFLITCI